MQNILLDPMLLKYTNKGYDGNHRNLKDFCSTYVELMRLLIDLEKSILLNNDAYIRLFSINSTLPFDEEYIKELENPKMISELKMLTLKIKNYINIVSDGECMLDIENNNLPDELYSSFFETTLAICEKKSEIKKNSANFILKSKHGYIKDEEELKLKCISDICNGNFNVKCEFISCIKKIFEGEITKNKLIKEINKNPYNYLIEAKSDGDHHSPFQEKVKKFEDIDKKPKDLIKKLNGIANIKMVRIRAHANRKYVFSSLHNFEYEKCDISGYIILRCVLNLENSPIDILACNIELVISEPQIRAILDYLKCREIAYINEEILDDLEKFVDF